MISYPRPRVPIQPVLSLRSLGREKGKGVPSVLDAGQALFVTSGRMAIAMALQQMKLGEGDKVLMPAYHCRAMVEAVLWTGATPTFYRIREDTSVDLDDIGTKIDASTKVFLIVSYFGFPQDMASVRAFCDRHGLMLLEDCAHAFFGQVGNKPNGSYGDYAIASCTKFFPVYDGGCLVSARHRLDTSALTSGGAGFELKSVLNTMEKGFSYDRMKAIRWIAALPMGIKNVIWRVVKRHASSGAVPLGPGSADGGAGFEPEWIGRRSSFMTRLIVRGASRTTIATKRRSNYRTLEQALFSLPGCRTLFASLPDEVVPYVLPVLVDAPEIVFPALKRAGVPVVRFAEFLWDGVDDQVCPVTADLSRRLMQFPCHQELESAELQWMIAKIKEVLLTCVRDGNELDTVSP